MAQMPRAVLGAPRAFDLHQRLVGARDSQRRFVEAHVRPEPRDRVLDIGCGTGALLGLLPNRVTYLGVKIDPAYVDAARARFGEAGEFVCSDIGSLQLPSGRAFDLAIAYGVFHHLDDDTARRAVDVAATALADGGRFVIMEPCWVPGGQGWFERFLMGLDRGRFVRTIDDYAFLVATRLETIATHVEPDTCRLPYTMVVVEGCAP